MKSSKSSKSIRIKNNPAAKFRKTREIATSLAVGDMRDMRRKIKHTTRKKKPKVK
jgi:hypothetical protein